MLASINIKEIKKLLKSRKWSPYKLSKELPMNYSHVHRCLKGEANFGNDFIEKFINLCSRYGIDPNKYIFLRISLTKDNGRAS